MKFKISSINKIKKYRSIVPKLRKIVIKHLWSIHSLKLDNKKYILSLKNQPEPSYQLYAYRELYNFHEKKIINDNVRPNNGHCIDIGANIGFFTQLFQKKNPNQKVYSFEADKVVFTILKKNFKKNKNVICMRGKVGKYLNVDSLIKKKVQFIKIDIDGLDLLALKSCEQIIKLYKPKIIIEISEDSNSRHFIPYNDVISFLEKRNYLCNEILGYDSLLSFKKFNRELRRGEVINLFAVQKL